MPHDTTFFAIFGMLFYIFVPQYFGYVAIAMALWLGLPVIRVVWQTTKDIREIPDTEGETNEAKAEEENSDDEAEEEWLTSDYGICCICSNLRNNNNLQTLF